ncbi:alpha-aminoadipic semialdehyde synthase, mitochondrial-like isoform X3 [Lineus longissimus]|uniref:alpha-aminoadipic semialdehyde synthase, mitochondrial-like isoform X3 n=1 Tax=Lineus longissimus TaxID=88925 RepID=UPI002B4CCAAD
MWRLQPHRLGQLACRDARSALFQSYRCASSGQKVMAIRREDHNVWEGRAPLAPSHVKQLVKAGVKVLVQPNNRRAYTMHEYQQAGAIIQEDITEASLILGVKQIPIDALLPNHTYCFFSHTIKAQEENMPMLDAILEKNIRLLDYERFVDENGKRLVAFGKHAGVAGMINILHGMGVRLLALGHYTPFLHVGLAHNYRGTGMAKQAVRDIGYEIALGSIPRSMGPVIFIFTGSGNVSKGAREIFRELPHEWVEVEHLPKVARQGSMNKLYGCVVSRGDHYERIEGGGFDVEEFTQHPERYISTFSLKVAPYATCIVNGIYYAPGSPRLISIPDAKTLLRRQEMPWLQQSPGSPTLPHRLIAICDISADPGGSIEIMDQCTTIDRPFCIYDADQHKNSESFDGDGVVICSVEQLPAQIPIEATDYFGDRLISWVPDMLKSFATEPFEKYEACPSVKNAVITSNGKITPNYAYIETMRTKRRSRELAFIAAKTKLKKVLVLGSGYVSAPVLEYLTRQKSVSVTIASNSRSEAAQLASKYPNTEPHYVDMIEGAENLDGLVKEHDLIISMFPQTFHIQVAKTCIKYQKNMLTSSYISQEMRELHNQAKQAGVTLLNEMGLDPGIDHCLAMEVFDEVKESGGKVTSFISYCGGLPSPELTCNPLRYKFSWSPMGVLSNAIRPSRYLRDNEPVEIPAGGALMDAVEELDFLPGFNLEGIPNRDSIIYKDIFKIPDAHTILRGSIRYKGFCNAMKGIVSVGLISPDPVSALHPGGPDITWKEFMCGQVNAPTDIFHDTLKDLVFEKCGRDKAKYRAIADLGLLDDELVEKKYTPVDTLAKYLDSRLMYGPGERDLVILRNLTEVKWPNAATELRDVRLVVYGDSAPNGHSAMAKCVGYTVGVAANMLLEGEIQEKGVLMPKDVTIYRPVLQRLRKEGIIATEDIIRGK